jgi:ADP-ribose pyrophosphatase YjhB (NUDIX family)
MKKSFCPNCNKYGHTPKHCLEPHISVGILCVKTLININKHLVSQNNNIEEFNFSRLSNINKIDFFNDKIKFLLVQRKHSLNYIEFIRGLYDSNDMDKLCNMFELMSNNEIISIKKHTFDYLWTKLWDKTAKKKIYQKEYELSKDKFYELKTSGKLHILTSIKSNYDSPEWEIPKGRKNNNESNIDCAKREFYEETNIDTYDLLNINPIVDDFKGTNGKDYKHIFYTGLYNGGKITNIINNSEVYKIEWFNWSDAICKIRPYYKNKINIINQVFMYLVNINIDTINSSLYELFPI